MGLINNRAHGGLLVKGPIGLRNCYDYNDAENGDKYNIHDREQDLNESVENSKGGSNNQVNNDADKKQSGRRGAGDAPNSLQPRAREIQINNEIDISSQGNKEIVVQSVLPIVGPRFLRDSFHWPVPLSFWPLRVCLYDRI